MGTVQLDFMASMCPIRLLLDICASWIQDKLMMTVAVCLPGDENLSARQAIARWSSLQAAIAWSGISVRTLKRFPTERHLVDSGLMTHEEYDLYMVTKLSEPYSPGY